MDKSREMIKAYGGVFIRNAKDELLDGSQYFADVFLPMLEGFPVVSVGTGMAKGFIAMRDHWLFEKAIKFGNELYAGEVNQEAIEKRRKAIDDNEEWVIKEMNIIIQSLDKLDSDEKTPIISELYRRYLNNALAPMVFHEYMQITQRLFLSDLVTLFHYFNTSGAYHKYAGGKRVYSSMHHDDESLEYHNLMAVGGTRLLSLGLLQYSTKDIGDLNVHSKAFDLIISVLGIEYCTVLIDAGLGS